MSVPFVLTLNLTVGRPIFYYFLSVLCFVAIDDGSLLCPPVLTTYNL